MRSERKRLQRVRLQRIEGMHQPISTVRPCTVYFRGDTRSVPTYQKGKYAIEHKHNPRNTPIRTSLGACRES
jgi:hypothetical protein